MQSGPSAPSRCLPVPCPPFFSDLTWVVVQIDQCAHPRGRYEADMSAVSAVPAIGTPARDIFFPAETDASVPAIACFDLNPCCVHR